jgi:hypothetical protein
MRDRRIAESTSVGTTKAKGDGAPPSQRKRPDSAGRDEIAGRHGLHHDQSIDTEHEPFSVVSQRCRGEYP